MIWSLLMVLEVVLVLCRLSSVLATAVLVPVLVPSEADIVRKPRGVNDTAGLQYVPIWSLIEPSQDTSEFWRETPILSLVASRVAASDPPAVCDSVAAEARVLLPSRRTVRPICRGPDHQLCPQCPTFSNFSECELFQDSCREQKVPPSERRSYCDRKYGKWRSFLILADYSACRCCDECVFYRERDQSCMPDEYYFEAEEFLPVTSIDFRAGCNPYWGHPEQETFALKCDKILRRCVTVSTPNDPPEESIEPKRFRYEPPPANRICPATCHGYLCQYDQVAESECKRGAFLPDREYCNCCGRCSFYQQLDEKCAEFLKTDDKKDDGTTETALEEEFMGQGCDDGLVCRQGRCQDIHSVSALPRPKRGQDEHDANEPCKRELQLFKKKYGSDGHLHYDAPQCSLLWLYAPVQCRRFVCYCALEDGSFIAGIKVPRVEVSNMNCECARDKCRAHPGVECDGYGNYKDANFYNSSFALNDGPASESATLAPDNTESEATLLA